MNDICTNRHKQSPTSIEANKRAQPNKAVFRADIVTWAEGKLFTMKDVMKAFNRPANEVSPRLSELKERGIIRATDERRDGCAVLEVI